MQTMQVTYREQSVSVDQIGVRFKPISVLLPVLNEEKIIEDNTRKLIEFLGRLDVPYEILIIDNGSDDSTRYKGRLLEEEYPGIVRFLEINEKGAVGWAFKRGVIAARYDKIISLDMDLSIDLELFVPSCLDLLDRNSIVIGSKSMRGSSQKRPFLRLFASGAFILLSRMFLGLKFSDYSMSGKGYRREDIVGDVSKIDKGSSYVTELVYLAQRKNLKIRQIPVHCIDGRSSKFNFAGEVFYRFRRLLSFRLSCLPPVRN